jgi:hypothetical protein
MLSDLRAKYNGFCMPFAALFGATCESLFLRAPNKRFAAIHRTAICGVLSQALKSLYDHQI